MKVSFEAIFARDPKGIRDKTLLRQVEEVIAEVKAAAALSEIKHLSKMRGYVASIIVPSPVFARGAHRYHPPSSLSRLPPGRAGLWGVLVR
jgi:hypothetical protein